jgi:hypothetical protein
VRHFRGRHGTEISQPGGSIVTLRDAEQEHALVVDQPDLLRLRAMLLPRLVELP